MPELLNPILNLNVNPDFNLNPDAHTHTQILRAYIEPLRH